MRVFLIPEITLRTQNRIGSIEIGQEQKTPVLQQEIKTTTYYIRL